MGKPPGLGWTFPGRQPPYVRGPRSEQAPGSDLQESEEGEVVGCRRRFRTGDDVALPEPARLRPRSEHVVEPDVRIPGGEGVAGHVGMEMPESVDVSRVEHGLDRPPLDPPAQEPGQELKAAWKAAQIEAFAGCERVEVSGHHMEALP